MKRIHYIVLTILFALLAGIGMYLVRDTGEEPPVKNTTERNKTRDVSRKGSEPEQKNSTSANPERQKSSQENLKTEDEVPKDGIVQLKIQNNRKEPISGVSVYLLSPGDNQFAEGQQSLEKTSGKDGRIKWTEVPYDKGYRLGLVYRMGYPEVEFDPPFTGHSESSKEEIIQQYENGGYPDVDWISGSFEVYRGRQKNVQLLFRTEKGISGTVLKPGGGPAEGASVVLHEGRGKGRGQSISVSPADLAYTAEDGTFTLMGYPEPDNDLTLYISIAFEDKRGNLHIASETLFSAIREYLDPGRIRLGGNHSIRVKINLTGPGSTVKEFNQENKDDVNVNVTIENWVDHRETGAAKRMVVPVGHQTSVPGSFRVTGLRPGRIVLDPKVENPEKYENYKLETSRIDKKIPFRDDPVSVPVVVKEAEQ